MRRDYLLRCQNFTSFTQAHNISPLAPVTMWRCSSNSRNEIEEDEVLKLENTVFLNHFLKDSISRRFQGALLTVGYAVTILQCVQILIGLNFQRQFILLLLLLLSRTYSHFFLALLNFSCFGVYV
jgi:hypothetical protein